MATREAGSVIRLFLRTRGRLRGGGRRRPRRWPSGQQARRGRRERPDCGIPVRPCRHARRPYPRWGRCKGGASLAALHERLVENRVAPLVAGRIVALGALRDGLERVIRVVHGWILSE